MQSLNPVAATCMQSLNPVAVQRSCMQSLNPATHIRGHHPKMSQVEEEHWASRWEGKSLYVYELHTKVLNIAEMTSGSSFLQLLERVLASLCGSSVSGHVPVHKLCTQL